MLYISGILQAAYATGLQCSKSTAPLQELHAWIRVCGLHDLPESAPASSPTAHRSTSCIMITDFNFEIGSGNQWLFDDMIVCDIYMKMKTAEGGI